MLDNQKINEIIGIDESFKAPYRIMKILFDDDLKQKVFKEFLAEENNLNFDWFTNYFQEEHSDRKGKKQDFTPDGVVKLLSSLLGDDFKVNYDICAGTGGLTIKRWSANHKATFYCEEFSDRAMPFLLLNLSIRNVEAIVFHGDTLSRKCKHIYQLTPGDDFSTITELKEQDVSSFDPAELGADTVIMNPPYSLKWSPNDEMLKEDRFKGFDTLAPASKADFAFLLTGLHDLRSGDKSKMVIILPHGVLFRGQKEAKIRKKLLEDNYLDTVIGLPEKLFLNTDIPTAVLVLKKQRKRKDILFIDASKEFKKERAYNELEDEHINKILKTYSDRKDVDKFAHVAELSEIEENDYNLNIPRYVDTFVPEPTTPLTEIVAEMKRLDEEQEKNAVELGRMLTELVGTNPEADREIKAMTEYWCWKYGIDPKTGKLKKNSPYHVKGNTEQLKLL